MWEESVNCNRILESPIWLIYIHSFHLFLFSNYKKYARKVKDKSILQFSKLNKICILIKHLGMASNVCLIVITITQLQLNHCSRQVKQQKSTI